MSDDLDAPLGGRELVLHTRHEVLSVATTMLAQASERMCLRQRSCF